MELNNPCTVTSHAPTTQAGVYVLALSDDCYYVGYSNDVNARVKQHFSGSGALWTRLHKPIALIELVEGNTKTESQVTISYMKKYGWMNVRGSGWSQVKLLNPPKQLLR